MSLKSCILVYCKVLYSFLRKSRTETCRYCVCGKEVTGHNSKGIFVLLKRQYFRLVQLDLMSGLMFVISNQSTQRAENIAGLSQILLTFRLEETLNK